MLNTEFLYFMFMAGRRGCDRMVDGYTTNCAISACHHYSCEFEAVMKVVSDMWQVGGFLWVLRHDRTEMLLKMALKTINLTYKAGFEWFKLAVYSR